MQSGIAVDPTSRCTGSDLTSRYHAVRSTTECVCAPLSAEDQMIQPMPDASPAKWHQAHTTWFFETFLLLPYLRDYRPLDSRYTFLFNSYYKQLGGHPVRAQRGLWSRPSLEEVLCYRHHVDEHMLRLLTNAAAELRPLIEIGLNHEQQHQELILTDVKYALWTSPLHPAYRASAAAPVSGQAGSIPGPRKPASSSRLHWISYDGGLYHVGHEKNSFSFDNETPRHQVFLQPFRLASRLATNAEYLEFMKDAGYSRPELWLSDGWDTVNAQGWRAPLYWEQREDQWHVYTLGGEQAVDPDEPVCHVSYYEADAYARWAGARLATEFEWETAASPVETFCRSQADAYVCCMPGNFLNSGLLHPAGSHPPSGSSSPDSPQQLFGDTWEWTASPYVAYPGFQPAAGLVGEYNGKFMCNQLVLRGGSCATPADHIRASYRNFFPPHARWQFSGIRLAQ